MNPQRPPFPTSSSTIMHKHLISLLVAASLPSLASAAIIFEGAQTFGGADTSSRTVSVSLDAATSNVLLVGLAIKENDPIAVSSMTLDLGSGLSFTELVTADGGQQNATIWGLEVPALTAGSLDLTVAFNGDARHAFEVVQFSGATLTGVQSAKAEGGSSATITGLSAGDAVYDIGYHNSNGTASRDEDPREVARFNNSTLFSSHSILAADGDYTALFDIDGNPQVAVVALSPAAAPIPEPSTIISLVAGGLVGLLLMRRVRRS